VFPSHRSKPVNTNNLKKRARDEEMYLHSALSETWRVPSDLSAANPPNAGIPASTALSFPGSSQGSRGGGQKVTKKLEKGRAVVNAYGVPAVCVPSFL
jgi:hypothetical protein